MPKVRRLVDGLSLRRTGLNPGPVNLGNAVDKVAVGQDRVFIEYFSLSRITLSVLHSRSLMPQMLR
jgi:hypothetical protein